MPEPAKRLFEESKMRALARRAGVVYVGLDGEYKRLVVKLHAWDLKAADRALRGLPEAKDTRVPDGETLTFGLPLKAVHDEATLQGMARSLLDALATFRAQHGSRTAAAVVPHRKKALR